MKAKNLIDSEIEGYRQILMRYLSALGPKLTVTIPSELRGRWDISGPGDMSDDGTDLTIQIGLISSTLGIKDQVIYEIHKNEDDIFTFNHDVWTDAYNIQVNYYEINNIQQEGKTKEALIFSKLWHHSSEPLL